MTCTRTTIRLSLWTMVFAFALILLMVPLGGVFQPEQISYRINQTLYLMDITRRVPVPLLRPDANVNQMAWSPDGSQLAYTALGKLYTIDVGGRRGLRHNPTPQLHIDTDIAVGGPQWSPDGTMIAYLSGLHSFIDVYLYDFEGSPQRLTNGAIVSSLPVWSPDSALIAYTDMSNNVPDVFTVSAGDGEVQRITNRTHATSPVWSVDGERLTFIGRKEKFAYIMAMQPGQPDGDVLAEVRALSLVQSPQSDLIAVSSLDACCYNVDILQPDGTMHRVADGHNIAQMVWASDGEAILGLATFTEDYDLLLINVQTGDMRQITNTPNAIENNPQWRSNPQ